jgi:hypothetical protein
MHSGEISSRERGRGENCPHTTACKDRIKFGTQAKPSSDRLRQASGSTFESRVYLQLVPPDCIVTGSESVLDLLLALHPSLQLRAKAVLHYRGAGSFNAALHLCRTALSQLIWS